MVDLLHIGRATLVKVPDQLEVSFFPKPSGEIVKTRKALIILSGRIFPPLACLDWKKQGRGLLIPFKWHSSWKPTFAFQFHPIAEEVGVGYLQNSTLRPSLSRLK